MRSIRAAIAVLSLLALVLTAAAITPAAASGRVVPDHRISIWDNGTLNLYNADGSLNNQIISGVTYSYSWSPDGTQVAVVKDESSYCQLETVNADGSNEQVLLNGQSGGYCYFHLTWSPSGGRIAFARNKNNGVHSDIYSIRPSGGHAQRLTFNGRSSQPAWAPSSRLLSYVILKRVYRFCIKRPAQRADHYVTPQGRNAYGLSWRDGSHKFAYTLLDRQQNHSQIYVGNLRHQRTPTRVPAFYPAWAPRGDRIAFTSRKGMGILNAKTGRTVKINSVQQAFDLHWSPGGRYLAFSRGGRGEGFYIYDSKTHRTGLFKKASGSLAWQP